MLVTAAPVAVNAPADLQPGDRFRFAFVTSASIIGSSGDISVYDAFVNGLANAAGSTVAAWGANWRAIASTLGTDAFSHLGGAFAEPVYSLGGHRVADNALDLWDGRLYQSIAFDELGQFRSGVNINSGTHIDGSRTDSPLGGGLGLYSETLTGGVAGSILFGWIVGSFEGFSTRPMYGMSGVLVVPGGSPVPEPAALALAAMALGCLRLQRTSGALRRWRFRIPAG